MLSAHLMMTQRSWRGLLFQSDDFAMNSAGSFPCYWRAEKWLHNQSDLQRLRSRKHASRHPQKNSVWTLVLDSHQALNSDVQKQTVEASLYRAQDCLGLLGWLSRCAWSWGRKEKQWLSLVPSRFKWRWRKSHLLRRNSFQNSRRNSITRKGVGRLCPYAPSRLW